ncbi:MAG: ribbon-helix-helix domain-containing protein [Patescibacteria group bacterium]
MRNVVNISLPKEMVQAVEDNMKKNHYATKSEFFRALLRAWLEGQLARELEESRKEFKAGKGKLLKSLKDLR